MAKAKFEINDLELRECLQTSREMQAYAEEVGESIKRRAMTIFFVANKKDNEERVSRYTPPKYINSFKVKFDRKTLKTYIINTDPGWSLVEYGAHPGGNPEVFILRYKPLTRALLEREASSE